MKSKTRNTWRFGIRHLLMGITCVSILLAVVVGVRTLELSNWDDAPKPGYFVVAVRVDGLNSRPILEQLSSHIIKTAPAANTAGEGEMQFCGVLGGYERVVRRKSSDHDLAELIIKCRSAATDAINRHQAIGRVSMCIIDEHRNRFTPKEADFVSPREQGDD